MADTSVWLSIPLTSSLTSRLLERCSGLPRSCRRPCIRFLAGFFGSSAAIERATTAMYYSPTEGLLPLGLEPCAPALDVLAGPGLLALRGSG